VLPGPFGPWGDQLIAAVERGEVDERVVDAAIRRILLLADRVGASANRGPGQPPRRSLIRSAAKPSCAGPSAG
jgi:beta-glucosidase